MHVRRNQSSENTAERKRYEGLDQLRGILAFSVMIFHYVEWQDIILPWHIQKPLELLGIYAVSTFYTLSGCALFIVYRNRTIDKEFYREFWIKRIFRIVPLFWLASLLAILTQNESLDIWKLFLNFSLLFSWLAPEAYYATGAWSIGNEWAFYTLFPLILWASRSRFNIAILSVVTCAITAWFAFFVISPSISLTDQWKIYIHPLNQVILFVSGILLGRFVVKANISNKLPIKVYLSVILFIAISYFTNISECVSGLYRFILIGICLVCCQGFSVTLLKHGIISKILTFLGTISYTVYLIHPLMHHAMSKVIGKIDSMLQADVLSQEIRSGSVFYGSILATLVISSVIYLKLEKPAIRFGRRLTDRKNIFKMDSKSIS